VHHLKGANSFCAFFVPFYRGGSRMKFNGTIISLEKAQTLHDFLTVRGFDTGRIAAELNGDIIPRKEYGNVLLREEDTLEAVRFVGGG
jgi:sulfur carrier protein